MMQIRWPGFLEEVQGEENIVCGGLSEPKSMAVACMHVTCFGAPNKLHNQQNKWRLNLHYTCRFIK